MKKQKKKKETKRRSREDARNEPNYRCVVSSCELLRERRKRLSNNDMNYL